MPSEQSTRVNLEEAVSMSDSDSDHHEDEYLMATRERRANAGNKMKKLLAQEVEEMQSKTETLNDDELDLLFKEDAEDDDFESGASEESGADVGDVEDQEEEEEEERQEEDNDLVVSESDEDESDEDDELNEKELERQESLRHKRKRKAKPPIIKRKAAKPVGTSNPAEAVKKKTSYEMLKAESLLVSDRRTSKRSHVVANKLEVYEKLSLAEEKRKVIQERLKKHREKQDEKVLTQEDRLRMSLETERLNLQSLDKYKEQEISKKQTRMAIQQRQKLKFKAGERIVSELTTSWIVTPIMEYEDKLYWNEQLRKREKKRKKYPRRQTKKKSPAPGTKDATLKDQQRGAEAKNENDKTEEGSSHGPNNSVKPTLEELPGSIVAEEQGTVAQGDIQVNSNTTITDVNCKSTQEANSDRPTVEIHSTEQGVDKDDGSMEPIGTESDNKNVTAAVIDSLPKDGKNETESQEQRAPSSHIKVEDIKEVREGTSPETSIGTRLENSVHFAEVSEASASSEKQHLPFAETAIPHADQQPSHDLETKPMDEAVKSKLEKDNGGEEEMVLEGPVQEVSRNFVTLYNFGSDTYTFDVRTSLFGPQWQGSQSQRSMNVENICKITMPENPMSSSEKSPIIPDLSFLSNFPVFGEYGKKVVYDIGLNTGKEMQIEIKTQPPSGVLFSNGVRKKCFITSKECQYFDPKNGVPYSDVEAYKVIQEVQNPLGDGNEESPNPHFRWFGFQNGGVYLDALQRPAKGVPEGF